MKVLVTGSTGFIGAQLCRALVERGHEVRAFHRSASPLYLLRDLPVEHVTGDLTRQDTLLEALQGMEVVFHCAGFTNARRKHLGRFYAVTIEGTRSLLQAARLAGVSRVVYTSSAAALGIPFDKPFSHPSPPILLDENHPWNYRFDYFPAGYAKHSAEREVQRAVAQGLDTVIVNPTMVMGAGDFHRQSSSIVVLVARQQLPALVEGGINVVHINDVVAGHLAAMENGKTGERYILGGENLTYDQLVQDIARIAKVDPPEVILPNRLAHLLSTITIPLQPFWDFPIDTHLLHLAGYHFYYTIRKSQTVLKLPPPRPAEEAIRDAYDWFTETGAIPLNVE